MDYKKDKKISNVKKTGINSIKKQELKILL